ncbi:peroxisome biogenesis protein 20 [Trichomonascus vanleenenianus]|uniref:Pex21p n=1 Tax=Trichomonascus vanleenenianus TaxID=2268995 RepID=UPI003EC9AAD1
MSSLFGGGEGSCGPVNPLQNLGKHVGETNSSQRERFVENNNNQAGFRSSGNVQNRAQLNNEFQAFQSGVTPQFQEFMPPSIHQQPQHYQPQHHHPQQPLGSTTSNVPQFASQNWASEFSKLSINSPNQSMASGPALQQPMMHNPMVRMNSMASSSPVVSQYSTVPGLARQTEHHQQHHINAVQEAELRAFEDAFDQVEQSLAESSKPEIQTQPRVEEAKMEESKQDVREAGDDLSNVAKTIINSLNDESTMSGRTSEKLKNSSFMNLMQKLSEKQAVVEGEKFVDLQGNEIEVQSTSPSPPPAAESSKPDSQVHPEQQQPHLPDPFEYMEQHPEFASPFRQAQELGPQGIVQASNWEEKYHEDDIWIK